MPNFLTNIHNPSAKAAGAILLLLSVVIVIVMLHHPSVSSVNVYEQVNEINQEADENIAVHSASIALIIMFSMCLSFYSKQRGFGNSTVLYGTILHWVGTFAMIITALMSGIIGPQLAEHYLQASTSQLVVNMVVLANI